MRPILSIRSDYADPFDSRFRLSISELTCIPSLKRQTDQDFTILLHVSPMDPLFTKRITAFESIGVQVIVNVFSRHRFPRYQRMDITDDDLFDSRLVDHFRRIRDLSPRSNIAFPRGLVFADGCFYHSPPERRIAQSGYTDDPRVSITDNHWVRVRHNRCSTVLRTDNLLLARKPDWQWVNWSMIERVSRVNVAMASALGCQLHPTRSRSVVFAMTNKRLGRKKFHA